MKRMRKKGSMMSLIAYLISIICVAIVLYKVFTFTVTAYPAIEVRELSNEYDYALNAPENVQIPHVFPETYFEGCGIGAVLFDVTKDPDTGELLDASLVPGGGHIGISRCGDGCIDYYNLMTGIMAAMLAWDLAQGVWEVASAWFGGHIMSQAIQAAVEAQMRGEIKEITAEVIQQFIKKQGKSKVTNFFRNRMAKSAAKSYLGKVFGTRLLRQAATETAQQFGEEHVKLLAKQAWKTNTKLLLSKSLGNRAKAYLADKLGRIYRSLRGLIDPRFNNKISGDFLQRSTFELLADNPRLTRSAAVSHFEGQVDTLIGKRSAIPFVDNLGPDQGFKFGSGITNLDDALQISGHIPSGYTDDICDIVQSKTLGSPATAWYDSGIEAAVSQSKSAGNLNPLMDFFERNGDDFGIFTGALQDFGDKGLVPGSVIKDAVISTGDDVLQKGYVSRVMAEAAADAFFSGASQDLIKRISLKSLRPTNIARIFAKYTAGLEAKVAKAYATRVVPGGTATGAGARDAIGISFGFFEEHVLGLPHPGHFLGMCCFKTNYTTRFMLEMGQFATALLGAVPGISFVQAELDALTLDIYSQEIDLCKADIYLYNYIKDSSIEAVSPGFTEVKNAKRWTGLIETDVVLRNYVDSPRVIFLNKTLVNEDFSLPSPDGMLMNVIVISGG